MKGRGKIVGLGILGVLVLVLGLWAWSGFRADTKTYADLDTIIRVTKRVELDFTEIIKVGGLRVPFLQPTSQVEEFIDYEADGTLNSYQSTTYKDSHGIVYHKEPRILIPRARDKDWNELTVEYKELRSKVGPKNYELMGDYHRSFCTSIRYVEAGDCYKLAEKYQKAVWAYERAAMKWPIYYFYTAQIAERHAIVAKDRLYELALLHERKEGKEELKNGNYDWAIWSFLRAHISAVKLEKREEANGLFEQLKATLKTLPDSQHWIQAILVPEYRKNNLEFFANQLLEFK